MNLNNKSFQLLNWLKIFLKKKRRKKKLETANLLFKSRNFQKILLLLIKLFHSAFYIWAITFSFYAKI